MMFIIAITLAATAISYGLITSSKLTYHTLYMIHNRRKMLIIYSRGTVKKVYELQPGNITIIPFVEEGVVTENTKFTLYAVALKYGEGPVSNYRIEFKVYCDSKLIVDKYAITDRYGLAKITITTPNKAVDCQIEVCHDKYCVGQSSLASSYFTVTDALSIPSYFSELKDSIIRTYVAVVRPVTGTPYSGSLPVTLWPNKRENLNVKNGVTKVRLDLHNLGTYSIFYQGIDFLDYSVYPSFGATMPSNLQNFYGKVIKMMIVLYDDNFTAISGVVTLVASVTLINGSHRIIAKENITIRDGIGFATLRIPSELLKYMGSLSVSIYYEGQFIGSSLIYVLPSLKHHRPQPSTPQLYSYAYCSSRGLCSIYVYLHNGTRPMSNEKVWIYASWGYETTIRTNEKGEAMIKIRAPVRYFISDYFIVVASKWNYAIDTVSIGSNLLSNVELQNKNIIVDLYINGPIVLSYQKVTPYETPIKVLYTEILDKNTTVELTRYNNYGEYCIFAYNTLWSIYQIYCYVVSPLKLIYKTPSIEYIDLAANTSSVTLTFRVLNVENKIVRGARVCVSAYYTAEIPYKGRYVEASFQTMTKCGITDGNGVAVISLPRPNISNARNIVLNYYAVASANGYISNFTYATVQIANVSLPDLAVKNLTIIPRYPVNGDLIKAAFEICNVGTKNASNVLYQVFVNGGLVNESTISLVAAGKCIPVTVSLGRFRAGLYVIEVIVNPYNTIREITRKNNIEVLIIRVIRTFGCSIMISPHSIPVNVTTPLRIELVDCPWVKSINITMDLTGVPTEVKNITAGPGLKYINGSLSKIIKNNRIEIRVKGSRSLGVYIATIAYMYVKGLRIGILTIRFRTSLMDAEGRIFKFGIMTTNITVGVLKCDFDHNGRLDVGDVVLLLRILVGEFHSNVPCDLNHNGRLDIGDAVLLLKKLTQT